MAIWRRSKTSSEPVAQLSGTPEDDAYAVNLAPDDRGLADIGAAAVIIGPSGIGPWQNRELMAFLRAFVERGAPVIPVLLPGGVQPALPTTLRRMTWVDLAADDALDRLVWGIRGEKPWLLS